MDMKKTIFFLKYIIFMMLKKKLNYYINYEYFIIAIILNIIANKLSLKHCYNFENTINQKYII